MSEQPQILGRQPDVLHITPSRTNPWYGTIIEGRRFTAEQLRELDRIKAHPDRVASLTVRRNATSREMYWPTTSPPPQFEFDCPVRSRRAGRVEVISPAGLLVWVDADGFAGRGPTKRGSSK